MAPQHPDPIVLSPDSRFSPAVYRTYSPSPTRSAKRNTDLDRDPLLANLSPTETLNALTRSEAWSSTQPKRDDALSKSIAEASASERALGVRAAQAGKQLREWCNEVQGWVWPNHGFALPSSATELRQMLDWAQRYTGATSPGQEKECDDEQEYWGSFPAGVAQYLAVRLEPIPDEMESLYIEQLKDYGRLSHSSSRSRPVSGLDYQSAQSKHPDLAFLDDFTALITATIMNALPYLSRLVSLLDCWSTRLTILRRIPSWLSGIDDTESSLELGWQSIGRRKVAEPWAASDLTRQAYKIMKAVLEDKVVGLGQKTDTMLDLLEGSDDVLPTEWIDRMDVVEEDYRSWVLEAERVVIQNEWDAESKANGHVVDDQQRLDTTSEDSNGINQSEADHTDDFNPTYAISLDGQGHSPDSNDAPLHDQDYFNLRKPEKLDLQAHVSSGIQTPSDMSPPDSASSGGFFSNMSSPELSTASRIEYIKSSPNLPIAVDPPSDLDAISRQSSQRTAKENDFTNDSPASSVTISPCPRPRTLSFTPNPTINEDDVAVDPITSESEFFELPSPKVENASRHSLEVVRPGVVRRSLVSIAKKMASHL